MSTKSAIKSLTQDPFQKAEEVAAEHGIGYRTLLVALSQKGIKVSEIEKEWIFQAKEFLKGTNFKFKWESGNVKILNEIEELLIESGYEVEWDVSEFITRDEIEEGAGDKSLILEANRIISSYKGNFIKDFNEKFGYNY